MRRNLRIATTLRQVAAVAASGRLTPALSACTTPGAVNCRWPPALSAGCYPDLHGKHSPCDGNNGAALRCGLCGPMRERHGGGLWDHLMPSLAVFPTSFNTISSAPFSMKYSPISGYP